MASKRRLRRKECTNKVKYNTQDEANKRLGKFYTKLVTPMRSYKCKFCNKWHLGHFTNNFNTKYIINN